MAMSLSTSVCIVNTYIMLSFISDSDVGSVYMATDDKPKESNSIADSALDTGITVTETTTEGSEVSQ